MNTYTWGQEHERWYFEYDFLLVLASSVEEARKLAIIELEKAVKEDYKNNPPLNAVRDLEARIRIVNTMEPTIYEPGKAYLIVHGNE